MSTATPPAGRPCDGGTCRTYVLDTSVLLADPAAVTRFAEHEVVLPLVVVSELEAKRKDPHLGYFARQALRLLDDLRETHGRLDQPMPVGECGGTVRVELNHSDPAVLPPGFRVGDNDSRILAVARNLAAAGSPVVLVSKDLPLRVKAGAVGLQAEEFRHELASDASYTGLAEVEVSAADLDELYAAERLELAEVDLPVHCGLAWIRRTANRKPCCLA